MTQRNLRKTVAGVSQNKRVRAIALEVINGRATVKIAGSSRPLYGLPVTGGEVVAGQEVFVDYISGQPVVSSYRESAPMSKGVSRIRTRMIIPDPDVPLSGSDHTHTESQITDLVHSATKIRGRAITTGSPIDGDTLLWDTSSGSWIYGAGGEIEEAPIDGSTYGRSGGSWVEVTSGSSAGIEEAPIDGLLYGRKDSAWAEITSGSTSGSHNDLDGIQGGSEEERYHLTAAQHTIAIQPSGVDQDGYLKSEDYNQFKLASAGSGAWYLSDLLDVSSGSPVDGQALVWDSEEDKWIPDNVGNVTNSGSVVDGHLAVFDGTTGKLIKDGGAPGAGGAGADILAVQVFS